MTQTILIPADKMKEAFLSILLQQGLTHKKAEACAEIFTANSVDGVYTHGVNRFSTFIEYVKEGFVDKDAEPVLKSAFSGIEQWDGNLGPGPLNALAATERAAELAKQFGIGCVAMANTNHWMRGGYYGWQAARKGLVFIGWTNTTALMPAWGATNSKLGNNPMVMALPFGEEAIVLDMAMSQYSFGAMELAVAKGEYLQVPGGYDSNGQLTGDPSKILASRRPLPIGYWKGAGLSLLLDILATVLSGGLATHQVSQLEKEHAVSQVFVCIDMERLGDASLIARAIQSIILDYKNSVSETVAEILYPGERVLKTRAQNMRMGIPVLKPVWDSILALY